MSLNNEQKMALAYLKKLDSGQHPTIRYFDDEFFPAGPRIRKALCEANIIYECNNRVMLGQKPEN